MTYILFGLLWFIFPLLATRKTYSLILKIPKEKRSSRWKEQVKEYEDFLDNYKIEALFMIMIIGGLLIPFMIYDYYSCIKKDEYASLKQSEKIKKQIGFKE